MRSDNAALAGFGVYLLYMVPIMRWSFSWGHELCIPYHNNYVVFLVSELYGKMYCVFY